LDVQKHFVCYYSEYNDVIVYAIWGIFWDSYGSLGWDSPLPLYSSRCSKMIRLKAYLLKLKGEVEKV
jgi:hypothetical protein